MLTLLHVPSCKKQTYFFVFNNIFLPKMFLQDFFFNICSVIWYVVDDIDVMTILKFMADKPEQIPMYVVTQSTQPIDIDCHMNLLGSQLWGLVRSVLREQSFKLYLVDVDLVCSR
jgi:hypothetical protein